MAHAELPPDVCVLERGWLSSNNILLMGDRHFGPIIIDTGYASHAAQTLHLVAAAIAQETSGVSRIINTHLHSDHCGGNAALFEAYRCPIHIPPGQYHSALHWDEDTLSYAQTGQHCPRFAPTAELYPGTQFDHAGLVWGVHAAPGHDPHSVLLFERTTRTLISADALWEHGFGIVFPEVDGIAAFDEVGASLDLIEQLDPKLVIPGHGAVFNDVGAALARARSKLAFFKREPARHAKHASKALIMFHMLEHRRKTRPELLNWLANTPIQCAIWERHFAHCEPQAWCEGLIDELVASKVLAAQPDGVLSIP